VKERDMNFDLARIGQILRERREEKGLSVAHIAETLCLRKSLIDAIEAGNWGPLPHEVYVKGFIKEYAALLKASGDIADCFVESDNVVKIAEAVTEPSPFPPPSAKREAKPRRFLRARYAVFVILGIVMFIFVVDRIEREKVIASKTETATQVAEKSPTEPAANSARPLTEVKGDGDAGALSAMSEPKRLMITCHERTWISAVIDGSEKKEFMLSPQEIIVLNAKEKFDLLIGNAGGIKLLLNGKDTEFTGKSGEVKRIQLS
jgi:cytoskeleton protein RodZ